MRAGKLVALYRVVFHSPAIGVPVGATTESYDQGDMAVLTAAELAAVNGSKAGPLSGKWCTVVSHICTECNKEFLPKRWGGHVKAHSAMYNKGMQ